MIHENELSALSGLPHLQQLLYLIAIRPYLDYRTGIVGIKRGISYQSLAEALYVEPHQGIKGGSPSKNQLRRALQGLERSGLVEIHSLERKLILHCILASRHEYGKNKVDTKPTQEVNTALITDQSRDIEDLGAQLPHPNISPTSKDNIPLNNNYFIFLSQQFDIFWQRYPIKKAKQKAWEVFQTLQPDEAMALRINTAITTQIDFIYQQESQGLWVAPWKYPANWLAQHCWEDEPSLGKTQEKHHASSQDNTSKQCHGDPFWESCKAGDECGSGASNVVAFRKLKRHAEAY